jgi:hypothetical protein
MSRVLTFVAWCVPLLLACNGSSTATTGGTATAGTGGTTSSGTTTGGTGGSGGSGSSGSSSTGGTAGSGTTGGGTDAGITGVPCNPTAVPDTCLTLGLICVTSGTCQYPQELNQCQVAVGCAPGLQCTPGYQLGGANVSVCLHPCTATADCPNPITSCQAHSGGASPSVCFLNFCGAGSSTAFYQPCNSAGTNDGLCLPVGPGAQGEVGVCDAAGTLPAWSVCSGTRADGGAAGFCDLQTSCFPFVGATGPTAFICAPVCAPVGSPVPGPACAAGQTCFNSPLGGFCLQDCGGTSPPPCPNNTFCGTIQGPVGPAAECLP